MVWLVYSLVCVSFSHFFSFVRHNQADYNWTWCRKNCFRTKKKKCKWSFTEKNIGICMHTYTHATIFCNNHCFYFQHQGVCIDVKTWTNIDEKMKFWFWKKTKPYWSYGWLYDVYVCFCEQTYLSYEICTNNNTLYNVIKFIYPKFFTTTTKKWQTGFVLVVCCFTI